MDKTKTIAEIRRLSLLYASGKPPANSKYRNERKKRAKQSRRISYAAYIVSDRWKAFRLRILKKRGNKCEECAARTGLEVHHLTYERLGHEKASDVKVLCGFHHSLVDEKHMRKSGYAFLAGD